VFGLALGVGGGGRLKTEGSEGGGGEELTAVHGSWGLSNVDHFGRVDEGPDEVFESFAPGSGEFLGGWITGAGGDDFLTADFIGYGVEVIIPGNVAGGAEFFGRSWRRVGSAAGVVAWRDLGEIEFFFGSGGFSGEEAEEELVEEGFG